MKTCPQCNTKCLNSAVVCNCGSSLLDAPQAVPSTTPVSEKPDSVRRSGLSGIKGWLLILVIQLAVIIPVRSVLSLIDLHAEPSLQTTRELGADLTDPNQIQRAIDDVRFAAKRREIYRRDGYVFRQIDQVFFGVTSLLAGLMILRKEPSAYGFMRFFVAGSVITGLLVLFLSHGGLWPESVIPFGLFCIWAIAWLLYFERSKRVRVTMGKSSPLTPA